MQPVTTGYVTKGHYTESQLLNYYRQRVQKEKAAVRFHEKVTNKALNIKPPLADVSLEDLAKARSVYGVRRPLTTSPPIRLYDHFHLVDHSWDQKVAKEALRNLTKYKISAREEEHYRDVPVLSNSVYGHRLHKPVEELRRHHVRIAHLRSNVFRRSGIEFGDGYPTP